MASTNLWQTASTWLQEVPRLNIGGLWLEAAVFKAGDRVGIMVTANTPVITN